MLQVNSLSFAYDKTPVLTDINFKVDKGEHISIVGESGCGKSTLLKIIYGLLQPQQGTLFWGEKQLMPFTTVAENVSHFLSVFYPEELQARTMELLEMIDMVSFAGTKVKLLSGGQQQRVALARVLAQKPELLLLDEPFGHIDNFRKNQLRRNLFEYLKKEGISCITATHDHQDILPYANRIIVLKDQAIMAKAKTSDLYNNPKNMYTATMFGEANLIPINIIKSYGDLERKIIVYAHEFMVSNKKGIPVRVEKCYFMGSHFLVEAMSGEQIIRFNSEEALTPGKEVFLNIALETISQRLKP